MPILGTLLFNLITGVVAFLAKYVTQKIAVALSISTVLGALILSIFVAMRSTLQLAAGLAADLHPMFGAGVSMIISPRVASLLGSYITFWVLVEMYKWKVNLMQLWARTI